MDTQAKRMSAAGAGRIWMRQHYPGSLDQADRLAIGQSYNAFSLPLGPQDPDTPTTRLLDTLLRSGSLKAPQARANLPDATGRTTLSSIDTRDRTLTDV